MGETRWRGPSLREWGQIVDGMELILWIQDVKHVEQTRYVTRPRNVPVGHGLILSVGQMHTRGLRGSLHQVLWVPFPACP